MENKQTLRQAMRLKLQHQSTNDKSSWSKAIFKQLINSQIFNQRQTISIYWATKNEVATEPIIKYLLLQNKKICLPMINEHNQMEMYWFDSLNAIKNAQQSMFTKPNQQLICHPTEIDCVIVPGLAFDFQNNRLGQGQGHYDRYLKKVNRLIIMLAFEIQKSTQIPINEWDVAIPKIYTEKFIYNKCNNKM